MINRRLAVALLAAAATTGCSSYNRSYTKPVPVQGRVLLANGQPLGFGRVVFQPEHLTHTPEVWGELDKTGRFVLNTFAKGDGAIPGKYTVVIEPTSYKSGGPVTNRSVPKKFTDSSTTDLRVDISADRDNVIELILR